MPRRRRNAIYDATGRDPHGLWYEYQPAGSELCDFELTFQRFAVMGLVNDLTGGAPDGASWTASAEKWDVRVPPQSLLDWVRRAMGHFRWIVLADSENEEERKVYDWSRQFMEGVDPPYGSLQETKYSLADALRWWYIKHGVMVLAEVSVLLADLTIDVEDCYGEDVPPIWSLKNDILKFQDVTERLQELSNEILPGE